MVTLFSGIPDKSKSPSSGTSTTKVFFTLAVAGIFSFKFLKVLLSIKMFPLHSDKSIFSISSSGINLKSISLSGLSILIVVAPLQSTFEGSLI